MRAHRLNVTVDDDHRLQVDLPQDFPPGPAEVIVLTEDTGPRRIVRLGGVLGTQSPARPEADPIAETLEELRRERADQLEQRSKKYRSTGSGS